MGGGKKTLNKSEIEGNYLNIRKALYKKPIADIILNSEKVEDFLLGSGRRQGCPLSLFLFSKVQKGLPREIIKKKK